MQATFPLARDRLIDSVDTVHLVQPIATRPGPRQLLERGFLSKEGELPNSITWFHNGPKGGHQPNLTIYENYGPGYFFLASVSLPAFSRGQNCDLLDGALILEWLGRTSSYASEVSGITFDAPGAVLA